MITVIPTRSNEISETDTETLRFAARTKDDSGFLFLNNYQDHVETQDHKDFKIKVQLDHEELVIPKTFDLTLKKDVSCILPFNMNIGSILLKYSTTQYICSIVENDVKYYFFYTPTGMDGQYCFDGTSIEKIRIDNGNVNKKDGRIYVDIPKDEMSFIKINSSDKKIMVICTLTREQSLNFWKVNLWGRERIIISDEDIMVTYNVIEILSSEKEKINFSLFPGVEETLSLINGSLEKVQSSNIFQNYKINVSNKKINYDIQRVDNSRVVINFKDESFIDFKEVFLKIDYVGDVGYAFIDGTLINDNLNNGTTWEIGLKRVEKELLEKGMYLYITPLKKGGIVKRDSAMAALQEVGVEEIAEISSMKVVSQGSIVISRINN